MRFNNNKNFKQKVLYQGKALTPCGSCKRSQISWCNSLPDMRIRSTHRKRVPGSSLRKPFWMALSGYSSKVANKRIQASKEKKILSHSYYNIIITLAICIALNWISLSFFSFILWLCSLLFFSLFLSHHQNSFHSNSVHFISLHSTSLYSSPFYSTPLHSTSLHFISLHSTSFHLTPFYFTSLHFISLSFFSFHSILLHSTSLHFISLHSISFLTIPLNSTSHHLISLPFISFHSILLHSTSLHFISLHSISFQSILPHSTSHYFISLHSISFHFPSFHFTSLYFFHYIIPLYSTHSTQLSKLTLVLWTRIFVLNPGGISTPQSSMFGYNSDWSWTKTLNPVAS